MKETFGTCYLIILICIVQKIEHILLRSSVSKGIPPRLAIKSSFPEYLETLILLYILWIKKLKPAAFDYGEEYQNVEGKTRVKFTDVEIQNIKAYLNIAATDSPSFLSKNALLDQHMEALQVGVLNFLKIAKVTFQDPLKSISAERLGGLRFKKNIKFTSVIDLLDQCLQTHKDVAHICLHILHGNKQDFESSPLYEFLTFFISFWAEQIRYKDFDGAVHDNILDVVTQPNLGYYKDGPARIIKKLVEGDQRYYYNYVSAPSKEKSEMAERIRLFSDIFKPVYLVETTEVSQLESEVDEEFLQDISQTSTNFENLAHIPKNILIKGVPGTGKSTTINRLIQNSFDLDKVLQDKHGNRIERVLRINIHSATTNASLMQGVSVGTDGSQLIYSEKRGLVLNFLLSAVVNPDMPFALVLEEIQENTLNSLIGDLIYLMESSRRTDLAPFKTEIKDDVFDFIETVVEADPSINYVSIPNLIETSQSHLTKKLVFPTNLYLFCTSNYRDDKKIIEDNLLRRFEVIEIYPQANLIQDPAVRHFFESLNQAILTTIDSDIADKCLIGHANWMGAESGESFYRALLKAVIELKDIRGIDFETVKDILMKCALPSDITLEWGGSFYDLIKELQDKSKYTFL